MRACIRTVNDYPYGLAILFRKFVLYLTRLSFNRTIVPLQRLNVRTFEPATHYPSPVAPPPCHSIKATMIKLRHMADLHSDHQLWLNTLRFCKDETIIFNDKNTHRTRYFANAIRSRGSTSPAGCLWAIPKWQSMQVRLPSASF